MKRAERIPDWYAEVLICVRPVYAIKGPGWPQQNPIDTLSAHSLLQRNDPSR